MLTSLQRPITDVLTSSTPSLPAVGSRHAHEGNEYIFLPGVASVAAGSWVTYDLSGDGSVALLTANAVGPVAVAMAAIVASSYGWFQIFGTNTAALCESGGMADNANLYIDTTDGQVDDTAVAGDQVHGAISRSTDSSGVFTVQLYYPHVTNI